MAIHKSAQVDKKAQIDEDVTVGAYSIIEADVRIYKGTTIFPAAVIRQGTTIGENSKIYNGAILGGEPQDIKYKGEKTFLNIGKNNIIREYATIHKASGEGNSTIIGDNNFIMANTHIGHNCAIGSDVVLANLVTLGGYVEIGSFTFVGGMTGIHQFTRVGEYAMVGGGAAIFEDIPPYMMAPGGYRPSVCGLNSVGLMRHNFSSEKRQMLKNAYRLIYKSGLPLSKVLDMLNEYPSSQEIHNLINFFKNSKRGIRKVECP